MLVFVLFNQPCNPCNPRRACSYPMCGQLLASQLSAIQRWVCHCFLGPLANQPPRPPSPSLSQLSKVWATFSKSAISNKKLNVQVSLSRSTAGSQSPTTAGTATGISPTRLADGNAAAFVSPARPTAPPPPHNAGVGRGYGAENGRRDVGRGGGGGLEDDSRMLAHKYEDVSGWFGLIWFG